MKAGMREIQWLLIQPALADWCYLKNEFTQSSGIDLRVDGITQEEIYNDKQYTDEVKKQVERLQDEPKSKSMHEDKEIFLETSLRILKMENIEFHEVRQRTATSQYPQCLTHVEEGSQFLSQMR